MVICIKQERLHFHYVAIIIIMNLLFLKQLYPQPVDLFLCFWKESRQKNVFGKITLVSNTNIWV